jgi:hypothetical protein
MLFIGLFPSEIERGFGWVNRLDAAGDSIVFGVRNIREVTSSLSGSYVFNPDMSFSVNFRHYWSNVDYEEYWLLRSDGYFDDFPAYSVNHDINFNTLNVDLRFSWWFAPGSEMVLLYRNTLSSTAGPMDEGYLYNLNESLNTPLRHTFSLRIVYFLDYNDAAHFVKHGRQQNHADALWQSGYTPGEVVNNYQQRERGIGSTAVGR